MIGKLSQFFTHSSLSTPYLLIGLIVLLLLLFILIGYFASRFLRGKKAPVVPKAIEAKEQLKKFTPGPRLLKFLAFFGYIPSSPLTRSFLEAIKLLKRKIEDKDPLYRLPWFLFIGCEGAGKSAMLEMANLKQPVTFGDFIEGDEKPACNWWFFERAVALDLEGKLVLEADNLKSDEATWVTFLNLLLKFRPKRPLDGIVLAIPASELIGINKLNAEEIIERANKIFLKLSEVQKTLGLRVPVYVVVTKCDLVVGFNQIASVLPFDVRQDAFGWSSPYSMDTLYSTSWLNEAFAYLRQRILRIQMEVFSSKTPLQDADSALIFLNEFNKLFEPLGHYLIHIFQKLGYQDNWFLRGLYFTGEMQEDEFVPSQEETKIASTLGVSEASYAKSMHREVPFIRNLLEQKIFPEGSLAVPVFRYFVAANHSINLSKITIVFIATFCALNFYKDQKKLQAASDDVIYIFNEMRASIEYILHIPAIGDTRFDRIFFDEQTKKLIDLMQRGAEDNFLYISVIPSWFHPLRLPQEKVLSISYAHIILKSIYTELNYRLKNLSRAQTAILVPKNISPYFSPLDTVEFHALNDFVTEIVELKNMMALYNDLAGTSADLDVLNQVIQYTFNYSLPKDFYTTHDLHDLAIRDAHYKTTNIDLYRPALQQTLKQLYLKFLERVLANNQNYQAFQNLTSALNDLAEEQKNKALDVTMFYDVLDEINQTISFMEAPELSWLDNSNFQPGNAYAALMSQIANEDLFGIEVVQDLNKTAKTMLDKMKTNLGGQNSPLTGRIFDMENGVVSIKPSAGLLSLREELTHFLNEPFMARNEGKKYQRAIPPGTYLLWGGSEIRDATFLVENYQDFIKNRLPSYPSEMQNLIHLMADRQLTSNINSLIAASQTFAQLPTDVSGFYLEETLRAQVKNIQEIMPLFTELLSHLSQTDVTTPFIELRNLISTEAYKQLNAIDQLLQVEDLYGISAENLKNWDGSRNPAFLAYEVADQTSLQMFLSGQFQRISYLAQEYAQPIISFLSANIFQLDSRSTPLITKWDRILEQIGAYQRKNPNNSVAALENTLLVESAKLNLKSCFKLINKADVTRTSGDYFINKQLDFLKAVYGSCQFLSIQDAVNKYSQLEVFFNQHLAGRFPFVSGLGSPLIPEVSIEALQEFFRLYDNFDPDSLDVLYASPVLGAPSQKVKSFINQMQDIKSFVSPYLLTDGLTNGYAVNVTFRYDQAAELGGHHLIDWILKLGNKQVNLKDISKTAIWNLNDPVSLSLKWANNAPSVPADDAKQPNLTINSRVATFSYKGLWSLLKFIKEHQVASQAVGGSTAPGVLSFVVPIVETTPNVPTGLPSNFIKVFMHLDLSLPEAAGGMPIATIPEFPLSAPTLQN